MESEAQETQSEWRVVGPSWASVRDAFLSMKPLFLSAAAASVFLTAVTFYAPHFLGQRAGALAALPVILLRLLIVAPVAVAVHRFILLGERTSGIISLRPSYTRRFALWLLLFTLVGFGIVLFGSGLALMSFLGVAGKLSFIAIAVASLFFSILFVLVFPAIAVEEQSAGWRDRLSASWRRMDGHFWLFFGLSIVTVLPVFVLVMVTGMAVGILDVVAFHARPGTAPFDFALLILSNLSEILTAMLGAAVASRFYAHFRDQTV
jgi:hypothetical protein